MPGPSFNSGYLLAGTVFPTGPLPARHVSLKISPLPPTVNPFNNSETQYTSLSHSQWHIRNRVPGFTTCQTERKAVADFMADNQEE